MQTHVRNNRETARPMQLWAPLSMQQKGPIFSEGYPHPGCWVDLPLGSLFRHLSGQSKVQAGGLTLVSGLTLETNSEGILQVGKRAVRGPWLCTSGNPAKWFSKLCDLRVVFLLNSW